MHQAAFATTVTLKSGETVHLRPLQADDATALGDYFLGLSEATRKLYAPHAFDRETAARVCREVAAGSYFAMLALRTNGEIIAYFILVLGVRVGEIRRYAGYGIELENATDCTLAPSVADAYQSRGLGSLVLPHCHDVLRRLGRRRLVLMGGVRSSNPRAQAFYRKFGFRQVGTFPANGVDNHDMIAELVETE